MRASVLVPHGANGGNIYIEQLAAAYRDAGCRVEMAGTREILDCIRCEHGEIERFAGAHAANRVDAAHCRDGYRPARVPRMVFAQFDQYVAHRHRRNAGDGPALIRMHHLDPRLPLFPPCLRMRDPILVDVLESGLLQRLAHAVHVEAQHA